MEDRDDLPFHWDLDVLRRAAAGGAADGAAQAVVAALSNVVEPPANNRPVDLDEDDWVDHNMQDFMMCKPRQGYVEPFSVCQVKSGVKLSDEDGRPYVWVMWWERRGKDEDVLKDSWIVKRRATAADTMNGWQHVDAACLQLVLTMKKFGSAYKKFGVKKDQLTKMQWYLDTWAEGSSSSSSSSSSSASSSNDNNTDDDSSESSSSSDSESSSSSDSE